MINKNRQKYLLLLLRPLYGHYTGQRPLAGTPS